MNNFNLIGARNDIDMSEIASVKEMILNKAREKSESITAGKEDSVRNDVMKEARASIANPNIKPFGLITKTSAKIDEQVVEKSIEEDIPKLKHNVQSADNSVYTASMRDEVMNVASSGYRKRTSLNESLKFLNTQAAIRLVSKTHSKIT